MSAPHLRRRAQQGFTLIELMVAILVSGIVLVGVFAFATIQKDTANLHHRQVLVHQALEGSMHSLGTDLRMGGLGFGRKCSEVRVWSAQEQRLINPGAVEGIDVGNAYVDQITGEPLWVLRDGVQAHWRSAGVTSVDGPGTTSADPESAADSVDVFRGELNIAQAGMFVVEDMPVGSGANAQLTFDSSDLINNAQAMQLSAVQQMFPPGSFVLLVPVADPGNSYIPETQSQCALVQVTGEVQAGAGVSGWELPLADDSGFNDNLEVLLGLGDETPSDANQGAVTNKTGEPFGADWDPTNAGRVEVVPLGRARWSRYEIDYTVPSRPMLVRSDIIGWRDGDPMAAASQVYPHCLNGGDCRMPQLYLPSGNVQPPRVAIGPMIEDMQISVGCDGWDPNSQPVIDNLVPTPDLGFEEKGPGAGPMANQANRKVDERIESDDRNNDEWLGNGDNETWAPDCVSWGTGERNADEWAASGPPSEQGDAPGFRMSPQLIRVTLLAKPDTMAGGSDAEIDVFYNELVAIEDRATMDAVVANRQYQTLTERFRIRNSTWRDPALR